MEPENILGAVAGALILGLVGLLGFALYDTMTAETFSLRKDSWSCTASHAEVHTTTIVVGKAVVPQVSTVTVCDRWERR